MKKIKLFLVMAMSGMIFLAPAELIAENSWNIDTISASHIDWLPGKPLTMYQGANPTYNVVFEREIPGEGFFSPNTYELWFARKTGSTTQWNIQQIILPPDRFVSGNNLSRLIKAQTNCLVFANFEKIPDQDSMDGYIKKHYVSMTLNIEQSQDNIKDIPFSISEGAYIEFLDAVIIDDKIYILCYSSHMGQGQSQFAVYDVLTDTFITSAVDQINIDPSARNSIMVSDNEMIYNVVPSMLDSKITVYSFDTSAERGMLSQEFPLGKMVFDLSVAAHQGKLHIAAELREAHHLPASINYYVLENGMISEPILVNPNISNSVELHSIVLDQQGVPTVSFSEIVQWEPANLYLSKKSDGIFTEELFLNSSVSDSHLAYDHQGELMLVINQNDEMDKNILVAQKAPTLYQVSFTIQNQQGEPVSNASISIVGVPAGAPGDYNFQLEPGTFRYRINSPDYKVYNGQFVLVDQDIEVLVELEALKYSLTFHILDHNNNNVNDASVTFDGHTINNGPYFFEEIPEGVYDYSVSKGGFKTITGIFDTSQLDNYWQEKTIILELETYSITFNVMDENGSGLEGALIIINGSEATAGQYFFGDLSAGTYTYVVTKDGFYPVEGDAIIDDTDLNVDVVLQQETTAIDNLLMKRIKIFPNPATHVINFNSEELINRIFVYDLLGSLRLEYAVNSSQTTINVNSLPKGIYLIEVHLDSGSSFHKVQICH
jgi:hypothetical protein